MIDNNDPLWLSFLKSNPEAMSSFYEWITAMQDQIRERIVGAVKMPDAKTDPKILCGELDALDKLRNLSTIADRERNAQAEYAQLKGNVRLLKA